MLKNVESKYLRKVRVDFGTHAYEKKCKLPLVWSWNALQNVCS